MGNANLTARATEAPALESIPIGILSTDRDGGTQWVNPAFCELAGVKPSEALGHGWMQLIPGSERKLVEEEWNRCVREEQPFEMEFQFVHSKRGAHEAIRVLGRGAVERDSRGQFAGLVATFTKLLEQREFEERLLQTFKATSPATGIDFYRSLTKELAEVMGVSYCVVAELRSEQADELTVCGMWDGSRFADMSSYTTEGTPCKEVLENGVAYIPSGLQLAFPTDTDLVRLEAESYLGVRLTNSEGRTLGILAILDKKELPNSSQSTDLLRIFAARAAAEIERTQGLERLARSESRYRTLFRDSPIAMAEEDYSAVLPYLDELRERGATDLRAWFDEHPDDLRECMKRVYVRNTNVAMRELMGDPARDEGQGQGLCLPDVSLKSFREEIIALGSGLETFSSEGSLQSHEGRKIRVELKLLVVPAEGPPLSRVLVSMIDITRRAQQENERRILETKMQQAQKLESLGVLAGGIAHDFNNLLVGVLGNADLALETSPSDPELREMLLEMRSAAHHASDLSTQMLAYSGGGNFAFRAVDLSALVHETLHLLESSISKKAELDIEIDLELPTVDGDPSPIRQVVMNLVTNASEAIGDKNGKLRVHLGQAHFDRDRLADAYVDSELPATDYVYIEVSDTGCGMGPEVLDKIFDPFYTTKFTGRGLGMAAVLGIVRAHGGAILVDTEIDAGSTFTVLLPKGQLPASVPRGHTVSAEPEHAAGELILVVDDEEPVRNLVSRVLLRSGYDVLLAENGREAIRIYQDNRASVRAIVLDMNMPVMDGAETSRQLHELDPDVRILFSSGYEERDATRRVEHRGIHSFIQKPYEPKDLVAELQYVLRVQA